jgi:hypothetical protein
MLTKNAQLLVYRPLFKENIRQIAFLGPLSIKPKNALQHVGCKAFSGFYRNFSIINRLSRVRACSQYSPLVANQT